MNSEELSIEILGEYFFFSRIAKQTAIFDKREMEITGDQMSRKIKMRQTFETGSRLPRLKKKKANRF